MWFGSATVRESSSRSRSRGFDFWTYVCCHVRTLGKLFVHVCLFVSKFGTKKKRRFSEAAWKGNYMGLHDEK